MTDQDELMKVVECCLTDELNCWDCPYCNDNFSECMEKLRNGAMELLKKQEQKKVEWRLGRAYCPECGQLFPRKKEIQYIRYCSYCGQAVKFDD